MAKSIKEVLDFAKKKWDEADDAEHWGEASAFKTIIEFLESKDPSLTDKEKEQLKPKVTHVSVRRGKVDEEEVNKG